MKDINVPPNHQIFHNRGFYYFTFIIPTTLIYAAAIIFYHKNNYFPYFEDIGKNLPEKRFVEVGFNVCAWIMLTSLLTTDGAIQSRNEKNKRNKQGDKTVKNDSKYKITRFLTCVFGGLTFLSCIAFGSILVSDSLKFYYVCSFFFLFSSSFYFLCVNLMFVIVKMNNKKQVDNNDRSNVGIIDWIHAVVGPLFFALSYLLKNNFFVFQNEIISKSLQFSGITLLFLNFVRILLRMPVINIFLVYKNKN